MSFPTDFTWGAAASSYQIEGAWDLAGKGPSVWDMFAQQPNRILGHHTGDVACDHYHEYLPDVGLMKKIGLKAYRLSISWPRVLARRRRQDQRSRNVAFYEKLIDALLAVDIDPWVTLFHWDYPYALFLRGGWLNPESPKWFAEYTQLIVDRLSDRVSPTGSR
jgi:beta-glucosidase